MDNEQFKRRGKDMIDYICSYLDTLGDRRVTPDVEPGYLRKLLPERAPENPESWEDIMQDVEDKIMPGVTHWQHPRFHAYFPSGNSFPSILGDMLSDAIGCIGFSWAASPACTELETIVLDWIGGAIGLPDEFLAFKEGSRGGGCIQTSASECVLVCMLAARAQAIKRLKQQHPFVEEGLLLSKLMAYCSREAHSCVEKAAMICFVKLRILETDSKGRLRADELQAAMEEDETMGSIPFFVSTTLGTTSRCSFDDLAEIGPVCRSFAGVWMHVDAAYAGNSFICPELKYLLQGIEHADSFNTNPNKWMMTNFDCSLMWVRDRIRLTSALVVDPLYLQHGYSDATIDYRHWGVPLSRRFRALKLWFVLRTYGCEGIRRYIRHHCRLAKRFERFVLDDDRFEVCNEVKLGLVCFRLKGSDKVNEKLLSNINGSGRIHMVPAQVNERYVIRFCAVAQNSVEADIDHAWGVICEYAADLVGIPEKEPDKLPTPVADGAAQAEVERRRRETLAYKRSFFVRMVSDPKIYNPTIAKTLGTARRHHNLNPGSISPSSTQASTMKYQQQQSVSSAINSPSRPPPIRSSSWISWPLAFLFQSGNNDEDAGDVKLRFRHLDTRLRLKAAASAAMDERQDGIISESPSPEPEKTNEIPKGKNVNFADSKIGNSI